MGLNKGKFLLQIGSESYKKLSNEIAIKTHELRYAHTIPYKPKYSPLFVKNEEKYNMFNFNAQRAFSN